MQAFGALKDILRVEMGLLRAETALFRHPLESMLTLAFLKQMKQRSPFPLSDTTFVIIFVNTPPL